MVRVISVHHFANQHVQVIEQPTACTVAPPNRLLSALMSNCVEVRDLNNESDVLFSFPTVDEVIQIVHCINGNYVATLETKFNRQNKEINFVRVYINWDSIATLQQSKMTSSGVSLGSSECGMVQPMRARIAGRVTPTTNQSELSSLEMIEVPVKKNPNAIDCCQISGNLLVLSEKTVTLYAFQVKVHDISKLRFIDFEELPLTIELAFHPLQILLCENYIACANKDSMHLFKILESGKEPADINGTTENEFNFIYPNNGPIDYRKLLREEMLHTTKDKITVNLPTIVKENSIIHKNSPFTFSDKDMIATITLSSMENKTQNYRIENLIQLKLIPILIESAQRQVTEEFKSIVLKPLHIDQNLNKSKTGPDSRFLRSDYNKCLNSVVCVVATQQEGYLYHFDDADPCIDRDNCLAIYPFTAPVFKIVMEDYFLHALTETGLESYTLRYGHQMCRNFDVVDNVNAACPPVTDSICLVGLRPFLGVEQILLAENHLVLLANSEISPAHSVSSNSSSNASFLTLYNLELPAPKMIFNDISIVANVHRFTSVQTYCHLMSEAHMILRMVVLLKKWCLTDENVKLVVPVKLNNDDVIETYRTSCALLGDHFIMCNNENEYSLAIPYYKMARVLPHEVLRRIKKIQEQSGNQSTKGLMYYLKKTLLEINSGVDADRLFGPNSKQNFSEAIFELLEVHGYEDLPNLILKSRIIREYSTDKLISILSNRISEKSPRLAEKYLALAILYIQKCNTNSAKENIENISQQSLCDLLLENYNLVFETTYSPQSKSKGVTTFSELTILLITVCPELLCTIFVTLVIDKKVINLHKLLKVFIEYLPSSIGNDCNFASVVLQKTLENYFERYFSKPENIDLSKIIYERGAGEAVKLLVRSYLSQLQILQMKEQQSSKDGRYVATNENNDKYTFDEDDDLNKDRHQEKLGYNHISQTYFEEQKKKPKGSYLFSNFRYEYLDKMPPFQIDITSKLYETSVEDYPVKQEWQPNEEADLVLKKLQALLCSQVVPKQVMTEVNTYLSVNENLRGSESLMSIIMGTNDAILLLIDACPQCLLQFGKDRFCRTDEWKFLIATVQRRILRLSQNGDLKRVCFFHKKILKDILTHVASSMTLEQLMQVFPQRFSTTNIDSNKESSDILEKAEYLDRDADLLNEIQTYEPYIMICKETMHANQINKLITTTGQQLLCSLNL
ncbi:unnamed protein product [Acanthoscelides obtectus]|uniref:Uncharacterized protein n=2 Tax=Acanthoscelides obtectus TaxID=200917 RepID=A0A9P0M952_ACAOB|nr:unnamed protein product [Acanthoscelides obtectus]CAK1677318.1 Hermansky-Pudlak syndrome 3 protein homolog [Acanthoscelides obtectus]